MNGPLGRRIETWRTLGPRRGTEVVLRRIGHTGRGAVRRQVVRVRPPRAGSEDVERALGGEPLERALERVREALPELGRWEAELAGSAEARASLLRRADDALAHRVDLLGSGPVELGPEIDWHRDFKHGRRWPLVHHTRIRVVYGDGSDIKVPWELSRAQHLPLLAMAHRVTGDPRYADEVRDQLRGWIAANPVEYGVNWACTMDVGIRAANWVVALALLAPAPWMDEIAASLVLHGRFIRSHLETHIARGNHYLSDVAGLIVVAALFHGGAEGRAWADWAAGELEAEMAHQVRPDGADHEMSLGYHRLVAELLLHGSQIAEALAPGRLTPAFHARLDRMLDLMAGVARPDGLTPVAGDADDGRFLPLGDHGAADPRAHLSLFARAGRDPVPATGHAAFPGGGWWVMRAGGAYVLARCGDVGLGGEGAHAHNDLLSFELALGGQPLVVDPGSYVYTADAAARNRFRSTGAHATLRIGGAEQRPLPPGRLFALPDTAPQRLVAWEPQAGGGARWTAEHEGFPELPGRTRHRRTLELAGDGTTLTVTDEVELGAPAPLEWSFPLAAGTASADAGGVTARIGGVELRIGAEGVAWAVETGQVSPRYGVAVEAPVARARATRPAGATTVTFRLRPEPRG